MNYEAWKQFLRDFRKRLNELQPWEFPEDKYYCPDCYDRGVQVRVKMQLEGMANVYRCECGWQYMVYEIAEGTSVSWGSNGDPYNVPGYRPVVTRHVVEKGRRPIHEPKKPNYTDMAEDKLKFRIPGDLDEYPPVPEIPQDMNAEQLYYWGLEQIEPLKEASWQKYKQKQKGGQK